MNHNFTPGDEIRGKDSAIRGKVLKVLDEGWLMVLETEYNMEMNIHCSEVVQVEMTFFNSGNPISKKPVKPEKKSKGCLTIDLHWEKLPATYKRNNTPPLQAQTDYLGACLSQALKDGHTSIRIIHGKGGGNLRKAVLSLLASYPYIKSKKDLKVALEIPHGIEVFF